MLISLKFRNWAPGILIALSLVFIFHWIRNSKLTYEDNKLYVYRSYMWWKPMYILEITEIEKAFIYYMGGRAGYAFRVYLKNGKKTSYMSCLWGGYDYNKREVIKHLNKIGIDVELQDTFFPLQFFPKGEHDSDSYKSFHISKY